MKLFEIVHAQVKEICEREWMNLKLNITLWINKCIHQKLNNMNKILCM